MFKPTADKPTGANSSEESTGATIVPVTNCTAGSVYSLRQKKCVVCSAGTYADQKLQVGWVAAWLGWGAPRGSVSTTGLRDRGGLIRLGTEVYGRLP